VPLWALATVLDVSRCPCPVAMLCQLSAAQLLLSMDGTSGSGAIAEIAMVWPVPEQRFRGLAARRPVTRRAVEQGLRRLPATAQALALQQNQLS
jgi:hypothetical protein